MRRVPTRMYPRQPLRRRRNKEDERTNERGIGGKGEEIRREKSPLHRERKRELSLSLSSWGDSAFSKSATSWRHVGRRGSLNGVVHGRHRDGESSSAARITASAFDEKRLRDGTRKGETRQRKYANCNCKMISERIMQTLSASINIHIFLLLFFLHDIHLSPRWFEIFTTLPAPRSTIAFLSSRSTAKCTVSNTSRITDRAAISDALFQKCQTKIAQYLNALS